MKTEPKTDKTEAKADSAKNDARKPLVPVPAPLSPGARPARVDVAVGDLVPDKDNRVIDEDDESFVTLVDSVRVMGILQALHAWRRPDGTLVLADGERRWRAARVTGLPTVPCDVWPEGTHPRDIVLAGVVLNEQREAHSCLTVARRLRAVKNQFAETHEQVAARTGLPSARVKAYLNLFNASDLLLAFFDATPDLPLKTAVEIVRYERVLGEAAARRLIQRHSTDPLTTRAIETLRKNAERGRAEKPDNPGGTPVSNRGRLQGRIDAAFKRDAAAARAELDKIVAKFGLRLVPVAPEVSSAGSST